LTELAKRSIVALFGVPILLSVIYLGNIYFAVALVIISSLSLWEFYGIVKNKGAIPLRKWGLFFNIVIWAILYFEYGSFYFNMSLLLALILFIIGSFTIQLFRKNDDAIMNIATTLGGLIYINLMFTSLYIIREFHFFFGKDLIFDPAILVFSFIVSIWVCDTAAYFIGSKFGKNKLLPEVSPKKSWEGAIAGFFGAVITTVIFNLVSNNFSIFHSILMGSIVGVAGQIGDLAESQLKRDAHVKDSSSILPGHGGFLDRFDSIMFVSPLILIYLLILLSTKL